MLHPETRTGCSDIKYKLETMNMSYIKHDIPISNLKIVEWMNYIPIYGETC